MSHPVILNISRNDHFELRLHRPDISCLSDPTCSVSRGSSCNRKSCRSPVETQRTPFSLPDRRTAYAYNPEPQMYAPSSAASYFEAPGGAQVTVAGSSPPAVPSHSMVGITMDVGGSPIVSSAGAYLIHGGMDSTRHSLAHTSRSSPATVCTRLAGAAG